MIARSKIPRNTVITSEKFPVLGIRWFHRQLFGYTERGDVMYFDIHAHLYQYPYPYPSTMGNGYLFPNEEQLITLHDALGIDRAALMVLANAEEYVPQSVGEIMDIALKSNGRFVPFCNVDPRLMGNHDHSPLDMLLDHFKNLGCKGVGEVLPRMEFDDPKMRNLYRCTQKVGLPLLFDMNSNPNRAYGLYDDPGLVKLHRCLDEFPDLIFIGHGPGFWAEFGTLRKPEDRFSYITYPIDGEGEICKLMRIYPNLWVDLSAGSGYTAISRDVEYTLAFFREFSDRILFGTDICFSDQIPPQVAFLNDLR
ncbi:MAG TPA: hypothetical protein DER23_07710, partial [Clostridiales bacterium]|nr:hypothetical protein [Clostridiales bacterium]